MSSKYRGVTAEDKIEVALKIATETSVRQAALRTGISRKKIKTLLLERETLASKTGVRSLVKVKKDNPVVKKMAEEAVMLGVEKASEQIKDRIVPLLDLLYTTATEALEKSRDLVKLTNGKDPLDDWKVAQLKHLVDVWGTAIQSGKLLQAGDNKGSGDVTYNYNNVDARQIILSRIDRAASSEVQGHR